MPKNRHMWCCLAYVAVMVSAPVGSEIDVEQLADPDDSEAEHKVVPPEENVMSPAAARRQPSGSTASSSEP